MNAGARRWITGVGLLHLGFMIAEAGFWTYLVPKLGIYDEDRARATAALGMNMGAYNGVLGLVLIGLARRERVLGPEPTRLFATWMLAGVVVAGVVGGLTIRWTIPFFQSLPALIALGKLRATR